jgi:hypothetical protein
MKGPYQRLKYDLRRVWECPACKRRERLPPTITFRHCDCQLKQLDGKPVVMKLIADGVQRLTPPIVIQHEDAPASETVNADNVGTQPAMIEQPPEDNAAPSPQTP